MSAKKISYTKLYSDNVRLKAITEQLKVRLQKLSDDIKEQAKEKQQVENDLITCEVSKEELEKRFKLSEKELAESKISNSVLSVRVEILQEIIKKHTNQDFENLLTKLDDGKLRLSSIDLSYVNGDTKYDKYDCENVVHPTNPNIKHESDLRSYNQAHLKDSRGMLDSLKHPTTDPRYNTSYKRPIAQQIEAPMPRAVDPRVNPNRHNSRYSKKSAVASTYDSYYYSSYGPNNNIVY